MGAASFVSGAEPADPPPQILAFSEENPRR
jgi:hypothetical protein